MFSLIEKFKSNDDEEDDNPSWLYPLLFTLMGIFLAVVSALFGYWLYKKKIEYNSIVSNEQSYAGPWRTKKQSPTSNTEQTFELVRNPRFLPRNNPNGRAGGKRKNKISIKRRR